MARRDRLTELMEIIERRGRRGGRFPQLYDVQQLKDAWAKNEDDRWS
jgi:2-C-methyl-D-erythritol 4-phosphate cytidylyltransferase